MWKGWNNHFTPHFLSSLLSVSQVTLECMYVWMQVADTFLVLNLRKKNLPSTTASDWLQVMLDPTRPNETHHSSTPFWIIKNVSKKNCFSASSPSSSSPSPSPSPSDLPFCCSFLQILLLFALCEPSNQLELEGRSRQCQIGTSCLCS